MSISAKIREQLLSSFRAELAEHIQAITDGLLALEQERIGGEARQTTLENIFRAAHSLKGAARTVGATAIEQLAHGLENVLDGLQRETTLPCPELFTACYSALDAIQAVQSAYEAGETTPPPQTLQALNQLQPFYTQAASSKADRSPARDLSPPQVQEEQPETSVEDVQQAVRRAEIADTIRVDVEKLDTLMAEFSELLVTKIRAEQRLVDLRQLHEFLTQWQKEWLAVRSAYKRQLRELSHDSGNGMGKDLARLLDYLDTSQEHLRTAGGRMTDLIREYADDLVHMSLVVDELGEEIKRVRLLPLNTITAPFGRMVRDLAREAGKEAVLEVVGGEMELDKQILEQIKDPLIHLLRNAVDHGIEPPEQRQAAGKPRTGTITLTAEQLGADVVLSVSDDGAGLDMEAIRHIVATRQGVDEQSLSEAELVEAIFNVGITTKPIITDISGRGVGLSVVRRNIEALHGQTYVDWNPGEGSVFTLIVPLRLTGTRGLLVGVSEQLFILPLNNVEYVLKVRPEDIIPLEGQDALRYRGRPVPLVRLDDVLELPRTSLEEGESSRPVVIATAAERRIALAVDELAGEQEVVIKGLGKQMSRIGGISGATVMGSGEVILILNVADLIKLAFRRGRQPVFKPAGEYVSQAELRTRQRILIVDDSITTRTLEKNILEAVGYNVHVATNGREALNIIEAEGVPDLIVSDVAMPYMNGFELTRHVKEEPETAHVPVILVTSLDSPSDKAQGIEVGADAYIVKSRFDQSNLLETIEQLI